MPKTSHTLALAATKINTHFRDFLQANSPSALSTWDKQAQEFERAVSTIKVVQTVKKPKSTYTRFCGTFTPVDKKNFMVEQGVAWKAFRADPNNAQELARLEAEFAEEMTTFSNTPSESIVVWSLDKANKLKDPNAPHKPPTSYILFSADTREAGLVAGLPFVEQCRKIVELWRNASPAVKAKYTEKVQKLKAEYEVAMTSYVRPSDEELLKTKEALKVAKAKAKTVVKGKTPYHFFYDIKKKEKLVADPTAKGYRAEIDTAWKTCKEMKLAGIYEEMALKYREESKGTE